MGSQHRDVADDLVRTIADQMPVKQVYQDGLQPAAQETGKLLHDLVKTVRLALFPIQLAAGMQDRFTHFIEKTFRKVPEERRVPPPPQVLGPVLEGIRYEPEDTPIDEMFSELLARAADSDRVNEAHPSFPSLIRQLSRDEAVIIGELKRNVYRYHYTSDLDRETWRFSPSRVELDEFPGHMLHFPANMSFYMEHLSAIGIAGLFEYKNQEAIFAEDGERRQVSTRVFCEYRLTGLGRFFAHACLPAG